MNKMVSIPITKEWFDMILSGEKKEEYRKVKDYWRIRLMTYNVTHLKLINGYGNKRPYIIVEVKGIRLGKGKKEWGAIDGRNYYVLELGNILEKGNLS